MKVCPILQHQKMDLRNGSKEIKLNNCES
uniref:Uncharacterized protein n=1 Tax=Arundo donax TaxID=35708 RepID=A0A0A9H4H3_ARUDO